MRDLIGLQRTLVLQAAQHRQIDRVVVLLTRGERAGQDEIVGRDLVEAEGGSERQLVLRQRARLVGA